MSKKRFKKVSSVEEALKLLEEDPEDWVCPIDSSSDDEDLLHPDNRQDNGDSDYYIPSSESDEEYDPPSSHATAPGPSRAPQPTRQTKAGPFSQCPAPGPLQPSTPEAMAGSSSPSAPGIVQPQQPSSPQTGPLTPPPTTQLKRGRSTRQASAPLRQPFASSDSDSSEEWQPKRRGNAMHKTQSKHVRGEFATSRVREEEERWHDGQEEDKKPAPLRFMPARNPGPTFDTTTSWSPISLFQLFFPTSVVRTIIDNTNANATKRLKAGKKFKWEVLTVKDFYIFLSIIIFSGLVTVHHRSDYWRKKWPYNFPFPSNEMTRGRFEAILWSLHLSNPKEDEENESKRHAAEYDRLFKIKPLYMDIVNACKAYFQPYQNISIDERMVATKAQISRKQYMKNKPTKWGYKLFVLADASTAYTWNFFVNTGKSVSTTGQSLSYTAVMDLLPFAVLGGGYNVFTDNFYTSSTLFLDLAKKNIGCCGTIRKNCVDFPQTLNNDLPKKAERGHLRWIRRDKLLFVKWMDTREVTMCSTVHKAYSGQTVKRKVKEAGVWQTKSIPIPDAVVDYSRNKRGVDLSDALIGYYSVHHKTMKWYKTFFYHFVDIAVVNSFLLHKELFMLRNNPAQTKPYTQKTFREQLATEMLEFAKGSAPNPTPPSTPTTCMPMCYASEDSRIRKYCKRCHDAGILRVKTALYCRKCQVPLCLTSKKNCFQQWHDGQ